MLYRVTQDFENTNEATPDARALAAELATYAGDFPDMFEDGETVPAAEDLEQALRAMQPGDVLHVLDLTITAEAEPSFCWYYHDADAGEYHAIRRQSKPTRGYRAALDIDPETGDPRTWTGLLPTKAAALAVLQHLAPDAVLLPGLPAWLR